MFQVDDEVVWGIMDGENWKASDVWEYERMDNDDK